MASSGRGKELFEGQTGASSDDRLLPPSAASREPSALPAVRFASRNLEIEPSQSLQASTTLATDDSIPNSEISSEAREEIRSISRGLHNSQLQQRRMSNFAFEPVSLPVSRVPTNESGRSRPSRDTTRSGRTTPRLSPTPSAAGQLEARRSSSGADLTKVHPDPKQTAPRITPLTRGPNQDSAESSAAASRPSSASDQIPTRSTTRSQGSTGAETISKAGAFSLGPSEDSPLPSQEQSPSRTPVGGSGTVTPPTSYSRPFTPVGDRDDPYARSKRPPQSKNLDAIDARFVFGGINNRRRSAYLPGSSSSASLPRSSSGNDLKSQNRPSSTFFGGKKDHLYDDSSSNQTGKQHGSMSELKRFFGLGHHHKGKRSQSPSISAKRAVNNEGTKTPPHQIAAANVPFADDHGLESKYGKFGKVLGSGAGGSVRLIRRSSDAVTFAVKQFRERHTFESERDYNKKVTAEFCIGSTLHHGNIIETLDIVHEGGHWYEVMEYAPYDLFQTVMTGKMSKDEITCSFLQIVTGVTYLHSMGLAHRDLKLDNVVVNEHGIMKIIDFGSASVFRYPFENDIVLASGIVGSDPYLAPEVYESSKYDPQPTDIWSLAVIFACMSLRRFPWKAPRLTDTSYKLFASPPTPGTDPAEMAARRASEGRTSSETQLTPGTGDPRRSSAPNTHKPTDTDSIHQHRHHHHHHHHRDQVGDGDAHSSSTASPGARIDAPPKDVLKGPWRLLRLLPQASRDIIGLMLQIDPKRRATMKDLMADAWISDTPVCRQLEGGKIVKAEGHRHTLEQSTTVSAGAGKD